MTAARAIGILVFAVEAIGAVGVIGMIGCGPGGSGSSRYGEETRTDELPLPNGSACIGDPDSPGHLSCTVWSCANVPTGLEKKTHCTGKPGGASDVPKEGEYFCAAGSAMNNRCPGGGYTCNAEPSVITCTASGSPSTNPASTLGDCASPIYRFIDETQGWGTARIVDGPGGGSMVASCGETVCGQGQVAVEIPRAWEIFMPRAGDLGDGTRGPFGPSRGNGLTNRHCVAAPPTCSAGTFPAYQPPFTDPETSATKGGVWVCRPPCELVIQYAALYGNRRVCAARPQITCGQGQAPFLDPATETWSCRDTSGEGSCDADGNWDPETYRGVLLCIPC